MAASLAAHTTDDRHLLFVGDGMRSMRDLSGRMLLQPPMAR